MAERQAVLSWIEDSQVEMIEFLLEFGDIPSPRGYEAEASQRLYQEMDERGLDAIQQPVIGDRSNAIGTLRSDSSGEGDSLVLNAHIDTAYGNPVEDEWVLPEQHRVDRDAWQEGKYLLGDDIVNDKGPMAALLFAALALKETNVSLGGDLHVTGTVGEIGGTRIDEFQNQEYVGGGIGTRRLVDGGVTGDYALVGECTDWAVARMECGYVWFEIELSGSATYQPLLALEDPEKIEADHPGIVLEMARAIQALEEWASAYRNEHTREYDHGTVQPTAGVGAVRTGNPYAPAKAPGRGALYLDVRLPPEKTPEFVRREVEDLLEAEGIEATIESYEFHRGYMAEHEAVKGLLEPLENAHRSVRDKDTPRPKPHITSMWRDSNVFNEVGIPSINFGPPRSAEEYSSTKKKNALHVDDLVTASKIYALVAMEICGSYDWNGDSATS